VSSFNMGLLRRLELSAVDQPASRARSVDRFVEVCASPLNPGVSPVRIRVREAGTGQPLLILHGGWGVGAYPFDRQITALSDGWRIIVPDRSGYGGSSRLRVQATDFHRRAAAETLAVIDALGLDRPVLWGHSDGAVIALLMALDAPERVGGVVAEAAHVFRRKPASRAFFEMMRDRPADLGQRIAAVLAAEHGGDWRQIVSMNGDAWLRLAEQGGHLYDRRLPQLHVPVLVLHGARDPRTEPGEVEALRADLGSGRTIRIAIFPDARHSPHSEPATAREVTRLVAQFLSGIVPDAPSSSR
jgi:pimeloyl-ACP methyl ester carboxylesterase